MLVRGLFGDCTGTCTGTVREPSAMSTLFFQAPNTWGAEYIWENTLLIHLRKDWCTYFIRQRDICMHIVCLQEKVAVMVLILVLKTLYIPPSGGTGAAASECKCIHGLAQVEDIQLQQANTQRETAQALQPVLCGDSDSAGEVAHAELGSEHMQALSRSARVLNNTLSSMRDASGHVYTMLRFNVCTPICSLQLWGFFVCIVVCLRMCRCACDVSG